LKSHQREDSFEQFQWKCLEKKIEFVSEQCGANVYKPEFKDAKDLRNLLIHFRLGHDREAQDQLTLSVVEDTENELFRWMLRVQYLLGIEPHPTSEDFVFEVYQRIAAMKALAKNMQDCHH
jgi:hypothetical protein